MSNQALICSGPMHKPEMDDEALCKSIMTNLLLVWLGCSDFCGLLIHCLFLNDCMLLQPPKEGMCALLVTLASGNGLLAYEPFVPESTGADLAKKMFSIPIVPFKARMARNLSMSLAI